MTAMEQTNRPPPRLVSVVMPTYNGAATIDEQLTALAGQTYAGAWELIVADNGSSDDTVAVAERRRDDLPQMRIIAVSRGQGVAVASNDGAAAAQGDFVVFCHQDDVADPAWLGAHAAAAQRGDAVGGRNDYTMLNDPLVTTWRPPQSQDGLPTAMRFLPYAVGANLGVWADVLDAVGGWSEHRSYGGEDVDLCWRIQLASYRLVYAPDALMHFRFRSDITALRKQFTAFGRAEPHLFVAYRDQGAPASSLRSASRSWLWGLRHLPDLWSSEERKGIWVRTLAYRWGRLKGSIESRTVYL